MKIFVINLADRADRRRDVEKQLDQLEYSFFPAISVRDNPEQHFNSIERFRFLLETGRLLTRSEIACYASHLLLWKKCVELDEPIVILKDDFYKTDCFEDAIDRAQELIDECGFIRLEASDTRTIQSEALVQGPFTVHRLRRAPYRTTAYAIAPATARSFLKFSEQFAAPVDHVIRKTWLHNKPLFLLSPAAVELAASSESPSIDRPDKSFVRHLAALPRFLYRAWTDHYALTFDRRFETWVPQKGENNNR